jgi:hypothetical protein
MDYRPALLNPCEVFYYIMSILLEFVGIWA